MKQQILLIVVLVVVAGCGGTSPEVTETSRAAEPAAESAIKLDVAEPEPLPVPEYREPSSDTDWPARVNNKEREVVEVLNIINPVAAYIVAGFDQYGDRFSATVHEEWADTQAQLQSAMALYEDCKSRMDAEEFDKQLFLDMEEVWQILVKTGVAGVRTKNMVGSELSGLVG